MCQSRGTSVGHASNGQSECGTWRSGDGQPLALGYWAPRPGPRPLGLCVNFAVQVCARHRRALHPWAASVRPKAARVSQLPRRQEEDRGPFGKVCSWHSGRDRKDLSLRESTADWLQREMVASV